MIGRVALRLIALLAVVPVLLGQIGRWHPLLDILNALLAPVLILLGLLLLLSLYRRDGWAGGVIVAGLAIGIFQLTDGQSGLPQTEAQQLRIVTLSTWHSNPHPAALGRAIETELPDIVLLQETNGSAARIADQILPEYFRIKSCPEQRCSEMILSRWPLQRITLPQPKSGKLPDLLAARIDAPFGPLQVINVHLPRPGRDAAIKFRDELVSVVRQLGDRRLIVAGDFNLGTGSFALAQFSHHAGLRRIEGFAPTYPANLSIPAFVAIDHMFVGSAWTGATCHRVDAGTSDHHGIACDLQ